MNSLKISISKRKSTINRLTVFFYRLIAKALFVRVLCGNNSLGVRNWWIGELVDWELVDWRNGGLGFVGLLQCDVCFNAENAENIEFRRIHNALLAAKGFGRRCPAAGQAFGRRRNWWIGKMVDWEIGGLGFVGLLQCDVCFNAENADNMELRGALLAAQAIDERGHRALVVVWEI